MIRILLFLLAAATLAAQPPALNIDDARFHELKAKRDAGGKLTAEERDYMESTAEHAGQTMAAKRNQAWAAEHPARESTGLVPLPDLGKGMYQNEQGGLYPDGADRPPRHHLAAGIALAKTIVPMDANGGPATDGKIVLLTIGYSNANQESRTFAEMCQKEKGLNPKLVVVNGAVNGQGAAMAANPQAKYWETVAQQLADAGVTARQVEAIWMKQANGVPKQPFPVEVKKLQKDVVADLHNLHDKFPNLKIVYLSSRTYGGYAVVPTSPEPHAYEGGFAFKWVIADQIAGKPDLNFDPAKGEVKSPWVEWGPYLWADGMKGRKDGKLVWEREDFGPDGTHPSLSGRAKVARLLMDFFKTDPTAKIWFLGK